MRKGLFLLVFYLLSVFLLFASCRSQKREDKLTIQVAFYSEFRNAALINAIAEKFQQRHPEIKVKIINFFGDYGGKLLTMIAAETPPDIMVFLPPLMIRLADKGLLLSLDRYMREDKEFQSFKKDLHLPSMEAGKHKGSQYAVPFWTNSLVLFYNKDLFDKEKIAYPDETWDLNKLLLTAKRLTKDTDGDGRIDQYGFFDYLYILETFGGLYTYIRRMGQKLFNEDMSECLIDKPETVQTIKWCFDFITRYRVTPSPFFGNEKLTEYEEAFLTGKVAMVVSGWWSMSRFVKINNFKWSVAPLPKGKIDFRPSAAMFLGAYSKTKHPDECWKFLKFLISEDGQKILCKNPLGIPVRNSIAHSPDFLNQYARPQENKIFLERLEGAEEYPYHFLGEMEWLGDANRRFQLVLLGKKSVEQACKEIAQEYALKYAKSER